MKKTYMVQERIHYGRFAQESQTDGCLFENVEQMWCFMYMYTVVVRKINFEGWTETLPFDRCVSGVSSPLNSVKGFLKQESAKLPAQAFCFWYRYGETLVIFSILHVPRNGFHRHVILMKIYRKIVSQEQKKLQQFSQ